MYPNGHRGVGEMRCDRDFAAPCESRAGGHARRAV